MDLYDRATYRFEGGLGALYYELTDFVRLVQYERDEYFSRKKGGGTLHCVPPCLNGIAAYARWREGSQCIPRCVELLDCRRGFCPHLHLKMRDSVLGHFSVGYFVLGDFVPGDFVHRPNSQPKTLDKPPYRRLIGSLIIAFDVCLELEMQFSFILFFMCKCLKCA